jgi:HAMP domain-containing protein
MKIKSKLLLTTLILALIPAIAITVGFYIISTDTLREQIKKAHHKAVSAVDTLIFVVVSDMVNIAFTAAPKVNELIEKQDRQLLKEKLNTIDQMNVPNVGTGRGLGYHIVIATDREGNVLARSSIVEGAEADVAQGGHILYLDVERQEAWNYPENFGLAFENAAEGRSDARKIIYDRAFLNREGYGHLIEKYGFKEMMGLTAFQPIFNQANEQTGILILITILNNNHAAIGAINAITGAEFTAITPTGEIVSSFFVNPPVPSPEIIEKVHERAREMSLGLKSPRGEDTVTHTIERIHLKTCPGSIVFREGVGVCYVDGTIVPRGELEERAYRFHFITEVDQDLVYVSIRGIAYDLTHFDTLMAAQARSSLIIFLIAFLVVGVLSIMIAQRGTAPILRFTKEIQNMEKEGFGKKIDIKTGDEIETLAQSFNSMSEKLSQNYEELSEQKSVLEIRVNAKTRELRELAANLDEQVKEKTKELQQRISELEKFQELTVGREHKMIELKNKIKELESKVT